MTKEIAFHLDKGTGIIKGDLSDFSKGIGSGPSGPLNKVSAALGCDKCQACERGAVNGLRVVMANQRDGITDLACQVVDSSVSRRCDTKYYAEKPGARLRAIEAAGGGDLLDYGAGYRVSKRLTSEVRLTSDQKESLKRDGTVRLTSVQSRARSTLHNIPVKAVAGEDRERNSSLATVRRGGKTQLVDPQSKDAVKILREAVRGGASIGTTEMSELVREVKEMIVDVMGVPNRGKLAIETEGAGKGRNNLARRGIGHQTEVEIVDNQARALVAGVAGSVALILGQRREELAAAIGTRLIGAVGRIAEQVTVHKAIELLESGNLGASLEQRQTVTEQFGGKPSFKERLFGRGGQLVSRTTEQGGRKQAVVPPGTRLNYRTDPDQPIIIKPSAVVGSVGHAEGKGARLSGQSGPGYSSVNGFGERVDIMSMGVAIGGMEIGGGGGSNFSLEIGDLSDFNF